MKDVRIKEIEIKNGWYWSVGGRYNWLDNHSRDGIGLNRELFNDSDKIHITVKGVKYELDTEEGRAFIKEHKSFETIGGAKIGYVPRSLMKEIE